MAAWKKHFREVPNKKKIEQWLANNSDGSDNTSGSSSVFQSWLPEIYTGPPNRIERYHEYEDMDRGSTVVSKSLDTIAEFCTQKEEKSGQYFEFEFYEDGTESEIEILKQKLNTWTKLNELDKRIFRIMRNILMYGDQFFVRDPETYKWLWVDHLSIEKIIVNEAKGKKPEEYYINNPDLNLQAAKVSPSPKTKNGVLASPSYNTGATTANAPMSAGSAQGAATIAVDATHIIHMSLSEGLDSNWPFGNSILEKVYKAYKQVTLLEDSILIYRVHRAPERRVFYIDTGNMPTNKAMAHLERTKNEINQRKLPSKSVNGMNVIDSTFNPMSMTEDFFFPQCLSMDTKIQLLDGRNLELNTIIEEYNSGKENFVYSVNQTTSELEVGTIKWAGITRKDAELVEVTLDNNEIIKCTPDHKFIMRDGSEVEAQDLKTDDSLMPLYLVNAKTSKYQGEAKYKRYICNANGKSKWVHTMVCPKIEKSDTVVHHIDCNSLNNNPTNLVEMNTKAHSKLHKELGSYHLINAWKDPIKRKNLVDGIRKYHADMTPEHKEMIIRRNRKNGFKGWNKKSDERKDLHRAQLNNARKRGLYQNKITFNKEVFESFISIANISLTESENIHKLSERLCSDTEFVTLLKDANKGKKIGAKIKGFGTGGIKNMCDWAGYNGYAEVKEKLLSKEPVSVHNHKVRSVEILNYREDTGCITVESKSNSHNFALAAGVFVHNSSDGRGSRVETLSGGENLGEINDLNYFQDQLKTGLNIPKEYIASGSQDASGGYSDGRATTALISEFRFSQYCERLQSLINSVFDKEFKLYLKHCGVTIDSSIYDLRLNVPQNFAKYRQAELDNSMISTWSAISDVPYISKRFAMGRWLQMTEDEIIENEKMWKEENPDKVDADGVESETSDGLRGMGVRPDMTDEFDMEDDLGMEDDSDMEDESPISGGENAFGDTEDAGPPAL